MISVWSESGTSPNGGEGGKSRHDRLFGNVAVGRGSSWVKKTSTWESISRERTGCALKVLSSLDQLVEPRMDHWMHTVIGEDGGSGSVVTVGEPDGKGGYHWPGNVRELENAIERAVLLADGDVIHARLLPPSLQMARLDDKRSGPLRAQLNALEKELIIDALKVNKGNRAAAARQLGITERIMGLRVTKYGLEDVHGIPSAPA
jgi:hypothetical protein